jgi:hypothetical protein
VGARHRGQARLHCRQSGIAWQRVLSNENVGDVCRAARAIDKSDDRPEHGVLGAVFGESRQKRDAVGGITDPIGVRSR